MEQSSVAAKAAEAASPAPAPAGSVSVAVEPAGGEEGSQEKKDEEGLTSFLQAVRTGTPEAVARLVETHGDGVLGDCTHNGRTCLHLAAERNHDSSAALVRLLLDGHAGRPELPHVDARDMQSFTPLHVVSFLQEMLWKKAPPRARRTAKIGEVCTNSNTDSHIGNNVLPSNKPAVYIVLPVNTRTR